MSRNLYFTSLLTSCINILRYINIIISFYPSGIKHNYTCIITLINLSNRLSFKLCIIIPATKLISLINYFIFIRKFLNWIIHRSIISTYIMASIKLVIDFLYITVAFFLCIYSLTAKPLCIIHSRYCSNQHCRTQKYTQKPFHINASLYIGKLYVFI